MDIIEPPSSDSADDDFYRSIYCTPCASSYTLTPVSTEFPPTLSTEGLLLMASNALIDAPCREEDNDNGQASKRPPSLSPKESTIFPLLHLDESSVNDITPSSSSESFRSVGSAVSSLDIDESPQETLSEPFFGNKSVVEVLAKSESMPDTTHVLCRLNPQKRRWTYRGIYENSQSDLDAEGRRRLQGLAEWIGRGYEQQPRSRGFFLAG